MMKRVVVDSGEMIQVTSHQDLLLENPFDGCSHQTGFTYLGWVRRCIAFGKQEGFIYKGYRKGYKHVQ